MDQQELKTMIATVTSGIEEAIKVDAHDPASKIFGALLLTGISVVGEMLLDVKRIADSAGPPVHLHFHCPNGSVLNALGEAVRIEPWFPPEHDLAGAVERMAQLLASKEALRKLGGPQITDGPEERGDNERARQAWVDGNWPAFQDEAAELLAAAIPGGMSRPVPGTTRDRA